MRAHGIEEPGYKKGANVEARSRITQRLKEHLSGLDALIREADDVFDAGLCLLAAKDFIDGVAVEPTDAEGPLAEKEGWTWVRAPRLQGSQTSSLNASS